VYTTEKVSSLNSHNGAGDGTGVTGHSCHTGAATGAPVVSVLSATFRYNTVS